MKKRGQITIFVIVGIVLIVLISLVLIIRNLGPGLEPSVPTDPVTEYVEQCLQKTSEDAIQLVGIQAGYVQVEADKTAALYDPFNSQFLAMAGGKMLLPYWLYQEDSGFDKSKMPELSKSYNGDNSIQSQLEYYISSHVTDCIDLDYFKSQGLIVKEMGLNEPRVIISDDKVNIKLNYPLEVTKNDEVKHMADFFAEVPVRLGKMYKLASDIRQYEMDTGFLETNTLNLITFYSRIDSNYLPPMYGGLEFKPCSERQFWIYPSVYDDLKQVLMANMLYLKVAGTDFDPIVVQDPDPEKQKLRQGVFANMIHEVSADKYPDVQVNFEHLQSFPMELDFGGRGILEPHTFQVDLVMNQVCMFEYKFAYNLKYPVVVTLIDSESRLNNRDFLFQFPMQVVLKNNFPRVKYSDVFGTIELPKIRSECNPEQYLSAPMSFDVTDDEGHKLDDVSISFQCGPTLWYEFNNDQSLKNITAFADRCYIGRTENGEMVSAFPQCSGGGMVHLEKSGYMKQSYLIGDTLSEERKFEYVLPKIYELPVEVRKILVKGPHQNEPDVIEEDGKVISCSVSGGDAVLQSFEQAIIRLTKTDTENGDIPPAIGMYAPGNTTRIGIAPGDYHVDIMLLRNERYNGELTIKKDSETMTIPDGMFSEKEMTYPEKDVMLPTVFTGGADTTWTVTKEELRSANKIVFYVFDEGPPTMIEDVGTPLNHREMCSKTLSPELE